MPDHRIEMEFVGAFWRAADDERDNAKHLAWPAMAAVRPEMIHDVRLREIYENIRVRFTEGETTELAIVARDFPDSDFELLCDVIEIAGSAHRLPDFTTVLVREAQAGEFKDLCVKAVDYLATTPKDGGKKAAEALANRLMNVYAGSGSAGGIKTKEQVIKDAKARATSEVHGIQLPWPKLEAACGPWVPGEIIGITAYSGEGKSTLAGNLFSGLIDSGVPCIPYPTEMGEQWLDRVVAARARVEQWRAEKQRWKGAEEQQSRFLEAYDELKQLEWRMVGRMNIGPAEIATAVRVLRKSWSGPVVFIVDHMHRLDYGSEEADKEAGKATRLMKNLAGELGVIGVLLYQPRKPPMGATHHGPVAGHQIRGHSSIWNELDVHLSPFRAWVKTNAEYGLAYAGTPDQSVACDYDENHKPKFTKPDDEQGKLDDEHVYIKVDKRRVGGEGPTVFLNYDKRTGRIYELDTTPRRERDAA